MSGNEAESPRGRIYLIRSALEGNYPWNETVRKSLDSCIGCRACETACPSGVPYGSIFELAKARQSTRLRTRIFVNLLTRSKVLSFLRRLRPNGMLPRLLSSEPSVTLTPKVQSPASYESCLPEPTKGSAVIMEGCVMSEMFPKTHEATKRLIQRTGWRPETISGCCGALHAHNGMLVTANKLRAQLLKRLPRGAPLVTNSAGCGSWLKEGSSDYKVMDISEFLVEQGLIEQLSRVKSKEVRATYHDACHLCHGQRIKSQPRQLLESVRGLTLVELKESEVCCGSGGIYNLTQPTIAAALLDRKCRNIAETSADFVVLGNPGCHSWIAQKSQVPVKHLAEVLEESLDRA